MKLLLLLIFIFTSTFTWAQGGSDVPPPPMPEYMKKHNFKPPPPPPSKTKLQSSQMNIPANNQNKKDTKFLVEDEPKQPKAFLKTETEDEVDRTLVENQEDDEESFETSTPVADLPTQSTSDLDTEFEKSNSAEQTLEKAQSDYLNDTENETSPLPEDLKNDTAATPIEAPSEADKLADVEDLLESKEQDQESRLANNRAVAGTKKFKAGMYKFSNDCTMRSDASNLSEEAGKIRSGQKLWIDTHDTGWHKVYKKSGAVFISADCLR